MFPDPPAINTYVMVGLGTRLALTYSLSRTDSQSDRMSVCIDVERTDLVSEVELRADLVGLMWRIFVTMLKASPHFAVFCDRRPF